MYLVGNMNAGGKRLAMVRIRVTVNGIPSGGEVSVTDLMFQPGRSASGWLYHVTEMPWSAGVTP